MPLYEYVCEACSSHLEQRQRFGEAPLTECPNCGGQLRRMLFPVGVIFKGSGFYCTDNPKSSTGSSS